MQKGALSTAEVCEALGLSQMKGRRWHVQGAVAIRGEGLYEGLDWCAGNQISVECALVAFTELQGEAAKTVRACKFLCC